MFASASEVSAQIASEDSLYESTWNYLFEDSLVNNGVIQSICATPDYLITIENTSSDPTQPDTVSAYYKNPFDRDGNPVQQYSLAMRNTESDWEHGNGMTYNSHTNEIYVALYSNGDGDNEGCLYVMDPDTLAFKRKIKIAEDYNILGIDYDSANDQYYTLTNADADYSLQRRDSSFNLIEDFGPIDPSPGTNFQDICLSGDYIFLSPLTYGMGIGDFMNIYSLSRRETLLSVNMDMGIEAASVEVEGVCMAHKGVFVCPVTVTRDDGSRYAYFYETTLPWFYKIESSARGLSYDGKHTVYTVDEGNGEVRVLNMDGSDHINSIPRTEEDQIGGTVSSGSTQVLGGTNYTVTFRPDPGYKVAGIYLDRTKLEVNITDDMSSYTLENVDGDHRITIDFTPIARPTAAPANAGTGGEPSVSDRSDENPLNKSGHSISGVSSDEGNDFSSEVRTEARKKAYVFTILICLSLFFCLTLLALYWLHVRRVRERQLLEHREERRRRHGEQQDGGPHHSKEQKGGPREAADKAMRSGEHRETADRTRRSGEHREAADRTRRSGEYREAADRTRRSGEYREAADRTKRSGEYREAADRTKRSGEYREAADRTKRSGEYREAADRIKRSGEYREAADRTKRSGEYREAADRTKHSGEYREAADKARRSGEYREAADKTKRSGEHREAADKTRRSGEHREAADKTRRSGEHRETADRTKRSGEYRETADRTKRSGEYRETAEKTGRSGEQGNIAGKPKRSGRHRDPPEKSQHGDEPGYTSEQTGRSAEQRDVSKQAKRERRQSSDNQ